MLKISVGNLEKSGNFYFIIIIIIIIIIFAVSDLQAAARKFLIIPNNRGVKNIFCIKYKAIQAFFLG